MQQLPQTCASLHSPLAVLSTSGDLCSMNCSCGETLSGSFVQGVQGDYTGHKINEQQQQLKNKRHPREQRLICSSDPVDMHGDTWKCITAVLDDVEQDDSISDEANSSWRACSAMHLQWPPCWLSNSSPCVAGCCRVSASLS